MNIKSERKVLFFKSSLTVTSRPKRFSLYTNPFQLASVILKQYVEAHWNSGAEKFRPPETTDAVSTSF